MLQTPPPTARIRLLLLCLLWLDWSGGGNLVAATADRPVASAQEPALALLPIVAGGLQNPVYLVQAPEDTDRFFILEQSGRISLRLAERDTNRPALDRQTDCVVRTRPGGRVVCPRIAGNRSPNH